MLEHEGAVAVSTTEIAEESNRALMADSRKEADSELLIVIAAGELRALEALYLRYHPRLARFLRRFTRRYETLEETINDTFMTVWRTAAEFPRDSQVSTWIFGIAYRTALRSAHRETNHTAARNLDERLKQTVDPVLDTEVQDWVERGLERLPDEQRLTVELAYNMGQSLEEIAEISGTPVQTVRTRMFDARQEWYRYLSAAGLF